METDLPSIEAVAKKGWRHSRICILRTKEKKEESEKVALSHCSFRQNNFLFERINFNYIRETPLWYTRFCCPRQEEHYSPCSG